MSDLTEPRWSVGRAARLGATLLSLFAGASLMAWSPAATATQTPSEAVQPTAWKVLLVAGDDKEPVFSNAVATLRERLVSYGIAPQDIAVLRADATNPAERATNNNVNDRWRGLAGPASTGCFVYMTSHGARDRGLYFRIEQKTMSPRYLAENLDAACGDRPTVVVMSGCFSGIYAQDPAMRRPNRVVLTAARPDRTSFGCHPDHTYTVYDQCFLRALERGQPWAVLALNVNACVAETEVDRNYAPASHPQAFVGGAADRLRTF